MKLFAHQERIASRMTKSKALLIAADTGTGKTITCLEALSRLQEFPALVLAPKHVVTHAWLEDARKHYPLLRIVAAVGTKKKRNEAFKAIHEGRADVLVMNYEAALYTQEAVLWFEWKVIILDESTKLKGPKTATTKFFHNVSNRLPDARKFCLSGYPAPNDRRDLWGQLHFLQPGVLPRSFFQFQRQFFWQPREFVWREKIGCDAEIDRLTKDHIVWVRKEDCLDLPEKMVVDHQVELDKEERKAYKQLVDEWVLELGDDDVIAGSAMTQLMKCRQMTAGVVKDVEGKWHELGRTKLNVVKELVAGERGQCIVVGQFRYEIERLVDALGDARPLYGAMGGEADRNIRDFKAGKFKSLVVHPGTMSHGLTFTNCARMIFASMDYSYETYVQVMDRIHRIGQTKKCTYDRILAKNTVDYAIAAAMERKSNVTLEMLKNARAI